MAGSTGTPDNKNRMKDNFKSVMDEFLALPDFHKRVIRQYAVQHLIDMGAEEVGSSDVSHSIVGLYNQVGSFKDLADEAYYEMAYR